MLYTFLMSTEYFKSQFLFVNKLVLTYQYQYCVEPVKVYTTSICLKVFLFRLVRLLKGELRLLRVVLSFSYRQTCHFI